MPCTAARRSSCGASAASASVKREPRKGRNPKTGDKVDVPPKKVPYFKPGKELKDLINRAAEEQEAAAAHGQGNGTAPGNGGGGSGDAATAEPNPTPPPSGDGRRELASRAKET